MATEGGNSHNRVVSQPKNFTVLTNIKTEKVSLEINSEIDFKRSRAHDAKFVISCKSQNKP